MNQKPAPKENLYSHAKILIVILILLWGIEAIDAVFFSGNASLDRYGIRPRQFSGLKGILLSPFLHHGFPHLIANTIPLMLLGWFVMFRRTSEFYLVSLLSALIGGIGVWLIGSKESVHVGASGVIFGYFGFLLARALFERSFIAILLALLAGLTYGSMIWGILPSAANPQVSWEGHLCGFLAGALSAKWLASDPAK